MLDRGARELATFSFASSHDLEIGSWLSPLLLKYSIVELPLRDAARFCCMTKEDA
jgi:hypothetical protein